MDLLSETLATTRLQSAVLAVFDMSAPWGIDCEHGVGSPCHYVLEGECWVLRRRGQSEMLRAGDLVMFPRWDWHALASAPKAPLVPIRRLLAGSGVVVGQPRDLPDVPIRLTIAGGGSGCRMLSMVFQTDSEASPLLAGLPDRVVIPQADSTMAGLLTPAVRFILHEVEHACAGYCVVSHRLAELLFMQVVRAQMLIAPEETTGLLRGLGDPGVARALAAMHAHPGRKWTVASLAEAGGFSRSVFAERFRTLTGTTPLGYLTGLRMLRARVRLREGAPVKSIADELGYRTSFAFAQAFKRRLGCPPSRYQDPPQ